MQNDKRNPELNIYLGMEDERFRCLSNPYDGAPFVLDGVPLASVESGLQGIKFEDPAERSEVFSMKGMDALRYAHEHLDNSQLHSVWWRDSVLDYRSESHHYLLRRMISEKIFQNYDVQDPLLETIPFYIVHRVGEEDLFTSLPAEMFIDFLVAERRVLWNQRNLA